MPDHMHHDLNNQIDRKSLGMHVLKDHKRSPKAEIIADFYALSKYHKNVCHNGEAPDYQEIKYK